MDDFTTKLLHVGAYTCIALLTILSLIINYRMETFIEAQIEYDISMTMFVETTASFANTTAYSINDISQRLDKCLWELNGMRIHEDG